MNFNTLKKILTGMSWCANPPLKNSHVWQRWCNNMQPVLVKRFLKLTRVVISTNSVSKLPAGMCPYVCHHTFTPQWWQPDSILILGNAAVKTDICVIALIPSLKCDLGGGHHFATVEDQQNMVVEFFTKQDAGWYSAGIHNLILRYYKCLDKQLIT